MAMLWFSSTVWDWRIRKAPNDDAGPSDVQVWVTQDTVATEPRGTLPMPPREAICGELMVRVAIRDDQNFRTQLASIAVFLRIVNDIVNNSDYDT